jgi:hypothetical protein
VYWLYSETFERVGLSEHDPKDPARYKSLWFQESDFGTFFQEEGWTTPHDLWSMLPRAVVDKWVNEEISTPEAIATECLRGPLRIVTPAMLEVFPIVWECTHCGHKAFRQRPRCTMVPRPYTLPERKRIVFVPFGSYGSSNCGLALLLPQPAWCFTLMGVRYERVPADEDSGGSRGMVSSPGGSFMD